MKNKQFDWQTQLHLGNRGEELFMEYYHEPLIVYPEHKADFKRLSDGKLVELKTDSYNMDKTPYFFFERWSDVHKKKPGGPWRSTRDRVGVFVYMFVRHNVYYEFDSKELVARLNRLTSKQGLVYVKNKAWVTGGYKVEREALKDIYTRYEFKPKD